ncbi:MAG: asparagine synthase (glutamine-hydrolyzing) [Bacteroidales bacterium]
MCGIAGFSWNNKEKAILVGESLKHRGPDDEGFYFEEGLTFVHRRLSIIDLSRAGHQPMFYHPESGACSENFRNEFIGKSLAAIVYNGEIYNFKEIKAELEIKGYVFTSNSDTELILAAYFEWGCHCVERFNGMWAFCIFDKRNQTLFLSRDRYGIKPLYYHRSEKGFAFASEIKPFLHLGNPFEIDNESLNHFFIFCYSPPTKSLINGIKKLEAGNYMVYSLHENRIVQQVKFWKPNIQAGFISLNDASEKIHALIEDAVKMRLLSDVEVGAFLSGGLDSSIVSYFMKKNLPGLKTFSIGFDVKDYNETAWAKRVADYLDTSHYQISFNAGDVKKLALELPYFFDDPFGDESMLPTFLVSQVASKHVKVALSGTGSDELFAGYKRYPEYQLLTRLRKLPPVLKKMLVHSYQIIHPDRAGKLEELIYSENNAVLYFKLLSNLFRGKDAIDVDISKIFYLQKYFDRKNHLSNVLNFDQNHYLTDDLLVKEDRATMAHGLEGRIPFLDYRLAELVNSLPDSYKFRHGEGKYILKKIFRQFLPEEIVYRKKQGFGVPLNHYFRNELRSFCEEIVFDFNGLDYYDKEKVKTMWNSHLNRKSDYSSFFWNLVIFNIWFEKFKNFR